MALECDQNINAVKTSWKSTQTSTITLRACLQACDGMQWALPGALTMLYTVRRSEMPIMITHAVVQLHSVLQVQRAVLAGDVRTVWTAHIRELVRSGRGPARRCQAELHLDCHHLEGCAGAHACHWHDSNTRQGRVGSGSTLRGFATLPISILRRIQQRL